MHVVHNLISSGPILKIIRERKREREREREIERERENERENERERESGGDFVHTSCPD